MKALQNRPVSWLVTGLSILLIVVCIVLRVPAKEGLNPSDDGVILAQSFRILNGEVPHRDFISIRPPGSAVMGLIHFISPLPLESSARWLVLIEYLIYSILIALWLAGSWFKGVGRRNYLILIAASIPVLFILNQNHYNLFPWTTVDALLWFSIALYSWHRIKISKAKRQSLWMLLLFFSASLSVLCRQTFILPAALLVIRLVVWEFRRQDTSPGRFLRNFLPLMLSGLLPGWLFAGVLTVTGSWGEFVRQMTGRTELWDTGVVSFFHSFWHSPAVALFGLAVVTGLIKVWTQESGKETRGIDLLIVAVKVIVFIIKVVLLFLVFLQPHRLFVISFAFFWLLLLDLFLVYLHEGSLPRWVRPASWVLLVAWTASISLGDNAPVFTLGWLAGTSILLQIRDFWNRIYRNVRPWQLIGAGLLVPALAIISVVVQSRVNYRDRPASELTVNGGDIFPTLENISLSPAMAGYLSEISRIYKEAGEPTGRFAVWPNNAIIYPLMGTRNPFPLDWMQPAEYVGNEERLMRSVEKLLAEENLLILVEKTNVKWIAYGQAPVPVSSVDYPYLRLLDSLAQVQPVESAWFRVYRTR